MLGETSPDEQAAVRAAVDGDPRRARPARALQPASTVAEVIEDTLLMCQPPGVMPGLAVFSTASQDCHGEQATALDEHGVTGLKARCRGHVEAAIAGQEHRDAPGRRQPAPIGEEKRYGRAVIRSHKDLLAYERGGVYGCLGAAHKTCRARIDVVCPERTGISE